MVLGRYADTVRWTTMMLIFTIRAYYKVVDFHFDIGNAFQATRTDDKARAPAVVERRHRLFAEMAPGFAVKGADGRSKVCEIKIAFQGTIDAANLFGHAFTHDLLTRAGCRRSVWDPELWLLHNGPTVQTETDLVNILAACANMPATAGAPPGWAAFGRRLPLVSAISASTTVRRRG